MTCRSACIRWRKPSAPACASAIHAYDNILKLDGDYTGPALQGTPYDMLCQIAEHCGLAVGMTGAEMAAMAQRGRDVPARHPGRLRHLAGLPGRRCAGRGGVRRGRPRGRARFAAVRGGALPHPRARGAQRRGGGRLCLPLPRAGRAGRQPPPCQRSGGRRRPGD